MSHDPTDDGPDVDESERRGRRALLATVALYGVALGAFAASGTVAFLPKEILLPLLFVPPALAGQLGAFWRDWAGLLGWIVLFDALRGLVYAGVTGLGLPVFMGYAIEGDRLLLGGETGPALLQRALYHGVGELETLLTVVHASHFAVFFVFGLVVWHWRRAAFPAYRRGLLLVFYLGVAGYALAPTVPPWMADVRFGVLAPLARPIMETYNAVVPNVVSQFDTNPIAAMPSLHCAIPAWMTIVGLRLFGVRGLVLAAYAALVCFGVVYGAEHYVVDVLAGIALAAGVELGVAIRTPRRGAPVRSTPTIRRATATFVALVSAAVLTATASAGLRMDWQPSEGFVQRELVGRSPIAAWFEARNAFARGDLAATLAHLDALGQPPGWLPPTRLRVETLVAMNRPEEAARILAGARPDAAGASEHLFWSVIVQDQLRPLGAAEWERAIARLRAAPGPDGPALAERLSQRRREAARPQPQPQPRTGPRTRPQPRPPPRQETSEAGP